VKAQVSGSPAAHHPSPSGLALLWLEILELAHSGHDDLVAERLARLAMSSSDLDAVFGVGSGVRLWPEYARAYGAFTGAGAREIAQKIRERRYDDVEVVACPASEAGHGDKLLPVRCNAAVYSVRLKRGGETDGIRIDTFVFVHADSGGGGWRTALKVGRKA
jgi:hypothetical protein